MGFLKLQFAAKYKKKLEGGLFGDKKMREKKSHSAKKIQRVDPIVSSGFVSYVKNDIDERGTTCTNIDAFPLAGPVA